MTKALIQLNSATGQVSLTSEAEAVKEQALASGALIGQVTNAQEQAAAVQAQTALQHVLSEVEKARRVAKEPVISFGRLIDQKAKAFVEEVACEMTRISAMVGSFQQLEQKRIEAEERLRRQDLSRLEREKNEAMAKAMTEEQQEAVLEHFGRRAEIEAPPPADATRAEGQRITNDWQITVSDIHLLYRCHPNCVKMEPLMGEIKNLLKTGMEVRGVTATPIVKAGVRTGPMRQAIEI